jgi:shikimate kinase
VSGLIVLVGMKHSGKTTIARRLAADMRLCCYDLDDEIQASQKRTGGPGSGIREIYSRLGAQAFRVLEEDCSRQLIARIGPAACGCGLVRAVAALGGGVADNPAALGLWKQAGLLVMLEAAEEILFERIARGGLPPFLPDGDPRAAFHELYERRTAVYRTVADLRVNVDGLGPRPAADRVRQALAQIHARRSP